MPARSLELEASLTVVSIFCLGGDAVAIADLSAHKASYRTKLYGNALRQKPMRPPRIETTPHFPDDNSRMISMTLSGDNRTQALSNLLLPLAQPERN